MFGVPHATKLDDLYRTVRLPVPVYYNATRLPQCPPGDLCRGCPNDNRDTHDTHDTNENHDSRENPNGNTDHPRDGITTQATVPDRTPHHPDRGEMGCLGIHEKLDAIMLCVDSIDARLARIERDIEFLEDTCSETDPDDSDVETDDSDVETDDSENETDKETDEEDSDYDPDDENVSETEYDSDESGESGESDDSKDSAESFELGQLVAYKDGQKRRLGRIAAIDASHTPRSFTIKFEDEEERYRDTEADKLETL